LIVTFWWSFPNHSPFAPGGTGCGWKLHVRGVVGWVLIAEPRI